METQGEPQVASEENDAPTPHKRQKKSHEPREPQNDHSSRKGKSCSTCRRLKVKCDAAEKGSGSCSRCLRLGIMCLSEKKMWTSAESEDRPSDAQLAITRLERAMGDVLQRLDLPALDLYSGPSLAEPFRPVDPAQQPVQDPIEEGDEVSQGPMNSLIEATQINSLRSQLRSVKLRRKGGMRRMDADLVSEHTLSFAEAEEFLELFKTSLSDHLFSASIPPTATLSTIRTSSTVLFTSIMMVTALHVPGKEALHETCHTRFQSLVSSAIFDRFHTLDDIRGLAVAAFWQPDLSWKLSGIAIRMATELNLHHAFHEVIHEESMSEDTRNECLEKARLWYLLYVLDHQSSVAYGRPPVMADLRPIRDHEALLLSPYCTAADRALLARVSGCAALSRAFETFGLEPKRTMGGDDASVLTHLRYTDDIRIWRDKWAAQGGTDSSAGLSLQKGVELHYHFSQLVLNSLVLRGRSLEELDRLPTRLRPLALQAVISGTSILEHFTSNAEYREGIVGMPLYLHSMIAFAVVFLLKMSTRWHGIGITINPSEHILPLIQEIIELLRTCKAGANHMVFSMSNGFDRMLKQLTRRAHDSKSEQARQIKAAQRARARLPRLDPNAHHAATNNNNNNNAATNLPTPTNTTAAPHLGYNLPPAGPGSLASTTSPQSSGYPTSGNNNNNGSGPAGTVGGTPVSAGVGSGGMLEFGDFAFNGNWEMQDEDLWNIAMGYDLLAPGLRFPPAAMSAASTNGEAAAAAGGAGLIFDSVNPAFLPQ